MGALERSGIRLASLPATARTIIETTTYIVGALRRREVARRRVLCEVLGGGTSTRGRIGRVLGRRHGVGGSSGVARDFG
jgi:hypothetical protein